MIPNATIPVSLKSKFITVPDHEINPKYCKVNGDNVQFVSVGND